jgi:formylglycine-generating enzyme required for sulfatase activity
MTTPSRKKRIFMLSCLALAASLSVTLVIGEQAVSGQKAQEEKPYGLAALFDGSGFARIPAGEFLMGSKDGGDDEQPVHRVRISQSFEMGKFEVTQAQWEAAMSHRRDAHTRRGKEERAPGEAAKDVNPSHFKGQRLPVENVSWEDVQLFLRALNARDSSHEYRLPTEAEWEYACRAGSAGDHAGSLDEMAWYQANSDSQTQPIGRQQPNAWGLYDMHGNVWEWVQDWYGPNYYKNSPAIDPPGPESGAYRVYRGGSWHGAAGDCRSAFRGFDFPGHHYYSLGFRLVRTAKR